MGCGASHPLQPAANPGCLAIHGGKLHGLVDTGERLPLLPKQPPSSKAGSVRPEVIIEPSPEKERPPRTPEKRKELTPHSTRTEIPDDLTKWAEAASNLNVTSERASAPVSDASVLEDTPTAVTPSAITVPRPTKIPNPTAEAKGASGRGDPLAELPSGPSSNQLRADYSHVPARYLQPRGS